MIGAWNTGEAFTVTNGSNVSNARPGTANTDRPNVVGTWHVPTPGIATFFNKGAFEVQQVFLFVAGCSIPRSDYRFKALEVSEALDDIQRRVLSWSKFQCPF